MTRRPTLSWLLGVGAFLVGAPLLLLWWLYPDEPPVSVERLLPDRLAAAVRIVHLREQWDRHWRAVGTSPQDALRELLEATDQWPRWVERYGLGGAQRRLTAYQHAVFTLLGDEAWVVFGEWHAPGAPEQSQVGLVLLFRGGGPLRSRLGPLADLLMEDWRIERSDYRGVALFEYRDPRRSRNVTFCHVGGWLCASWRQTGPGPLPWIIDRLRGATPVETAPLEPDLMDAPGAVAGVLRPNRLWADLRQFDFQRARAPSEQTRQRLDRWQQRLEGIDRVSVAQAGDSLLRWRATLTGPRAALLREQLGFEASRSPFRSPAAEDHRATSPSVAVAAPISPESAAVEFDMDLALAQSLAPLAGFAWSDALAAPAWLDRVLPGLTRALRETLEADEPDAAGARTGLALYRGMLPLLPRVLFWVDRPPTAASAQVPAMGRPVWVAAGIGDGDRAQWFGLVPTLDRTTSLSVSSARALEAERKVWGREAFPPAAFAACRFEPLLAELAGAPTELLDKDARHRLRRWQRGLRALELAAGSGLALRLDVKPDQWVLTLDPL